MGVITNSVYLDCHVRTLKLSVSKDIACAAVGFQAKADGSDYKGFEGVNERIAANPDGKDLRNATTEPPGDGPLLKAAYQNSRYVGPTNNGKSIISGLWNDLVHEFFQEDVDSVGFDANRLYIPSNSCTIYLPKLDETHNVALEKFLKSQKATELKNKVACAYWLLFAASKPKANNDPAALPTEEFYGALEFGMELVKIIDFTENNHSFAVNVQAASIKPTSLPIYIKYSYLDNQQQVVNGQLIEVFTKERTSQETASMRAGAPGAA